jgi:hypothetical protein
MADGTDCYQVVKDAGRYRYVHLKPDLLLWKDIEATSSRQKNVSLLIESLPSFTVRHSFSQRVQAHSGYLDH